MKAKLPTVGFVLQHKKAPGDTVVFTALVRDLAAAYPNLKIDVRVPWEGIVQNNPHVTQLSSAAPGVKHLVLAYKAGIVRANNGGPKIHFLQEFYNNFELQTGLKVPLRLPKPDLHLTETERPPLVSGRYWVVMAGGKLDVPIKVWRHGFYQQVVNRLRDEGLGAVQCGAVGPLHVHKPLDGALNLIGRTSLRDFMRIIRDAEGVICPITAAMHIAAAFDKPCVVVAGGREAPWWEAYDPQYGGFGEVGKLIKVPHRFLHTLGELDCCRDRGCWKNKLVKEKPEDLMCRYVVPGPQPVARCMEMITVDRVVDSVLSYYRDGTLLPINSINVNRIELEPKLVGSLPPLVDAYEHANPLLAVPPPPPVAATAVEPSGLEHRLLGGKMTVLVLCYGDYLDLHMRCLKSIVSTVPPEQLDLRVGANACCEASLNYLATLPITKLYRHDDNAYKYPVMREMLYDPELPITTNYVTWFDDDSYVVSPQWLRRLSESIVSNHPHGSRLFGIRFVHELRTPKQASWFREVSWFRNRPWQLRNGADAPNGNYIPFVSGGFWALSKECLAAKVLPDRRLKHNGGDITIGAQVHQMGFKIKDFNRGKVFVHSSGAPRRGYEEKFPWQTELA